MEKNDGIGIYSYYKSLPHGEKDGFVRTVAAELEMSCSSILAKLKMGNWRKLQLDAINKIIEERR